MAATQNWRLLDVDALDPELAYPEEYLKPQYEPVSSSTIQQLNSQCRGLLQKGDNGEALKIALENAPYGGDEAGKVCNTHITPPSSFALFSFSLCKLQYSNTE